MTTYNGAIKIAPTNLQSTSHAINGNLRCFAYPGSGVNPIPFYFLAMFDDLGIRHYWNDFIPNTNNAPTLGLGNYVLNTFVILGRF